MATLISWLSLVGARDATGEVVGTGTARFYVRGSTSEEIDIWADADETEPLTQPVTLDAAGKAVVYAADDFDIVVKDADGVTIANPLAAGGIRAEAVEVYSNYFTGLMPGDTYDLGGRTTAFDALETLAGSLGPDGEYKESNTTGVVTRQYQEVVRQFVSPYDFDCAGNGVADDGAKLQLAINRAVATGLPLNLETGTYKTTIALVAHGPICIYGASAKDAVITCSDETVNVLTVDVSAGDSAYGYELRDFTVNSVFPTTGDNAAIFLTGSNVKVSRVHALANRGIYCYATKSNISDCCVYVRGSSGNPAIGIFVNDSSVVSNCIVDCNYLVGTVEYSTGIVIDGENSISTSCEVTGSDTGFAVFGINSLVVAGRATGCNTSYSFTAYRSGAIGCYSFGAVTTNATFSSSSSTPYVNIGNSWLFQQPEEIYKQENSNSSPTFTFLLTHEVNLFYCTGSMASGTITIQWPSPTPALVAGTKYKLIIQMGSGANINAYSIDSKFHREANPGGSTMTAGNSYCATFEVPTTENCLVQVTPWVTITGLYWT